MYISGYMLDAGRPQRLKDRKIRLIKARKPFPFFKLPSEIRNNVYEKVFSTPLNDKIITPDPTYSRRRCNAIFRIFGRGVTDRTINNGLALLQSCQQAHEEAAAVLYGQNTFCFDNTELRQNCFRNEGSQQTYTVEVSGHCFYCCKYARTGNYDNRCYNARGGTHFTNVPYMEIVTMQSLLSMIGERNRLRIRHIQLRFLDAQFVKVLLAMHPASDRDSGLTLCVEIAAETLRFLSSSHNLDTFGICFGTSPGAVPHRVDLRLRRHQKAYGHVFSTLYHPHSDKIKQSLSSITGIRKLECEAMTDLDEEGMTNPDEEDMANLDEEDLADLCEKDKSEMNAIRDDYRKVKERMEYGYGKHLKLEVPMPWSKPYVHQIEWLMQDPKPKGKQRIQLLPSASCSKY